MLKIAAHSSKLGKSIVLYRLLGSYCYQLNNIRRTECRSPMLQLHKQNILQERGRFVGAHAT